MATLPLRKRHDNPRLVVLAALLLITCSLLACGGGNSGPTGPVTGSLAVAVSGLPDGASASVSVTGPEGLPGRLRRPRR